MKEYKRITKKVNGVYELDLPEVTDEQTKTDLLSYAVKGLIYNRGCLEDIEEVFGFSILDLIQLIGRTVWVKADIKLNDTDEVIKDFVIDRKCWNVDLRGKLYVGNEYSFKEYNLKDYGITWAFSKEELN